MNRVFTAFLLMLMLFSCSKDANDNVYNCDPDMNRWAIAARNWSQGISRDSLASFGTIDSQITIFRTLSNENKARIFQEKFSLMKSLKRYSSQELTHIDSLVAFVNADVYDLDSAVLDEFFVGWKHVAMNRLGWTELEVLEFTQTWLTLDELISLRPNIGASSGGQSDCECLKDWFCHPVNGDCVRRGCKRTRGGCGWIGNSDCLGRCNTSNPS